MRFAARLGRTLRVAKAVSRAVVHRHHPLLVHLLVIRRCTLGCAYCNEYGAVSKPVAADEVRGRLRRLAELQAAAVVLSGGEPLEHPEIGDLVSFAREQGMLVGLESRSASVSVETLEALNRAGLDHLQIALDDAPAERLRALEPDLRRLTAQAHFTVAVSAALGGSAAGPEAALSLARSAREVGVSAFFGVAFDARKPDRLLDSAELEAYETVRTMRHKGRFLFPRRFQDNLARGLPNDWSCRAGGRYLLVDEHGLVHYCADQRGRPGVPLERYGPDDIRREYDTPKACAPFCTVACVQRLALADSWRAPQRGPWRSPQAPEDPATAG